MRFYFAYSDEYRLVYFPISKAASSSLKVWMCALDGRPYRADSQGEGPQFVSTDRSGFEADYAGYRRFTAVRNPFSRALSCYLEKFVRSRFENGVRRPPRSYTGRFERTREKMDRFERHVLDRWGEPASAGISFEMFLDAIETDWVGLTNPDLINGHWGLQYRLGGFAKIKYDKVCRVESLDEDMARLADMLGIPAGKRFNQQRNRLRPRVRLDSSRHLGDISASELSEHPDYGSVRDDHFYSQRTIAIVNEKYALDLDELDYRDPGTQPSS